MQMPTYKDVNLFVTYTIISTQYEFYYESNFGLVRGSCIMQNVFERLAC